MNFKKLLCSVATIFCIYISQAQQLTTGSYSIRYDKPRDSGNLWVERAPVVAALLRLPGFDFFGTQEGYKNQTKNSMYIIESFFVTKHFSVSKCGLLTNTYHGKHRSDHFPVLTEVTLK